MREEGNPSGVLFCGLLIVSHAILVRCWFNNAFGEQ